MIIFECLTQSLQWLQEITFALLDLFGSYEGHKNKRQDFSTLYHWSIGEGENMYIYHFKKAAVGSKYRYKIETWSNAHCA